MPPPPIPQKRLNKHHSDKKTVAGVVGYEAPSWAPTEAPTDSGLSLTVLKGGVEINNISLDNRTHWLFGKLLCNRILADRHEDCVEDASVAVSALVYPSKVVEFS